MAYAPVYLPGRQITFTASAAITGGQVVAVGTTAYNVAPTAGSSDSVVGVAAADQAVVGGQVTVYSSGVHRLTASGSIAVGDRVIPAAAGAVATFGASTDFTAAIGKALSAATNGQTVDVLLAI